MYATKTWFLVWQMWTTRFWFFKKTYPMRFCMLRGNSPSDFWFTLLSFEIRTHITKLHSLPTHHLITHTHIPTTQQITKLTLHLSWWKPSMASSCASSAIAAVAISTPRQVHNFLLPMHIITSNTNVTSNVSCNIIVL